MISSLTSTASADSMAISEPMPPIAIPASAVVRANASFTPSPIMQTGSEPPEYSFMISIFSSGRRLARTSLIPTLVAIFSAASLLSPVSSIGLIPTLFSLSIVLFASSRSVSERARKPAIFPFMAMYMTVDVFIVLTGEVWSALAAKLRTFDPAYERGFISHRSTPQTLSRNAVCTRLILLHLCHGI